MSSGESIAIATIEGLYRTTQQDNFGTSPVPKLKINERGIVGDRRRNNSRAPTLFSRVGVRLRSFLPSRLIIDHRQVSIMDTTSAGMIGEALGIPEDYCGPAGSDRDNAVCRILGANMLLRFNAEGSSLYKIPNSTDFGPVDETGLLNDVALLLVSYNLPCTRPFKKALELLPDIVDPSRQDQYMRAAQYYRGAVTTPVACGEFALGQELHFFPRPVSPLTHANVYSS